MQDRYAYYPGCLASLSQKELDSSTRAVCAKLGVELVELESMTCCGAGDIHEAKPDYYLHLNARILGQAEALGIATRSSRSATSARSTCARPTRSCSRTPTSSRASTRTSREVGAATYSGGVDVRHLLWEVSEGDGYERFKEIAVRSLEGLKVAPFYGCQILRPVQAARLRGSRPARSSLERLIEACGAEAIDYPAKVKCCGFPIVLAREDVALGEAIQPLAAGAPTPAPT